METYDLLYICLIGIILFAMIRDVGKHLKLRAEEKSFTAERDKTRFFFLSYHSLTKIISNASFIWLLSLQPLEKSGVYVIILASLCIIYSFFLITKWPAEIMTIDSKSLHFRFRKSRSLEQIKGIVLKEKMLIIYANDYPKKTKLLKQRYKGDWQVLASAIVEFTSQNPDIVIKDTTLTGLVA